MYDKIDKSLDQHVSPRGREGYQDDSKAIRYIGFLLIVILFIVGFVYLTLPSQESNDVGHQTMEMQRKNFCDNKCCSARLRNIRDQNTGLYTAVNIVIVVANSGCVKCPDQNQFSSKDCNILK